MPTEIAGLNADIQPLNGVADGLRIILSGRSEPLSVKRLQETIDPFLEQGKRRILLECRKLEYLNSTAVGYLIHLSDSLAQLKGRLALLQVSPKIKMVFDTLGLQDFFPSFSSEAEAVAHLTKGSAPPASAPAPAPAVSRVEPPAPAPPPRPAAPAGTPIDPVRWIVFLRALAEKVDAGALTDACHRLKLPTQGGALQIARQILSRVRTAEELLHLLPPRSLEPACALYGLSPQGSPEELVARIVSLVRKSNSSQLSRVIEIPASPAEFAELPLDLTKENLLRVLEHTAVPRKAPAGALFARLSKAFGKEKVRKNRRAGTLGWAEVELEIDGRFAVAPAASTALLKRGTKAARLIQTFTGRLAIAARHYGKGNVFAVLTGKIGAAQAPMAEEFRAVAGEIGVVLVLLPVLRK